MRCADPRRGALTSTVCAFPSARFCVLTPVALPRFALFLFFFFNDTATTEIYTLSLHDALPISRCSRRGDETALPVAGWRTTPRRSRARSPARGRSEEHTSELQSHSDLVCRLLLEKKKKKSVITTMPVLGNVDAMRRSASRRSDQYCMRVSFCTLLRSHTCCSSPFCFVSFFFF